MRKIFFNLVILITFVFIHTAFAQESGQNPPKKVLTVQGDRNTPPPPPPAPLIYKAPDKNDLKDFVSADKTFQATFPGVPTVKPENVDNGVITNYAVYRQGFYSIVNTIDLVVDVENNREKIYENVRNTFLKTPKTTVEAERGFSIDGKTGKEFDVLQDFLRLKVRVLVVGARVYEIRNTVTNWHIIGDATKKQFFAETERFFNSFKHLKSPEKVVLPAPEGFLGEVKNTTYTNSFFNFSFDFPKDWYRLDDAEIKAVRNVGLDALKSEQEKTNKAFEEATQKEVVIIALAQGNLTSGKGANIGVGVLKQPNSQVLAEQVVVLTRNFLLTNPKIKLLEDVQTLNLNGTQFSTITLETNANGLTFNQKLFTTMRKGYSVTFVLTYRNSEELKELEKLFESLKFNAK